MESKNLESLHKLLICKMAEATKHYQSDFIIDIHAMIKQNEQGLLTGTGYIMFRDYGTSYVLANEPNDEMKLYINNKNEEEKNAVVYKIDFDKLATLNTSEFHYNYLLKRADGYNSEYYCVEKIETIN